MLFCALEKMRAEYEENVGIIQEINLTTMITTIPHEFCATRKANRGQNARMWATPIVSQALSEISRSHRQNLRSMAAALEVPLTTVHRLIKKEKAAVKHSSALKPVLTDAGKEARVNFCISQINPQTIGLQHSPVTYRTYYDLVCVDKK